MSLRPVIGALVQYVRHFRARRIRGAAIGKCGLIGPAVQLRRLSIGGGHGLIDIGNTCDLRDGVVVETWGGDIRIGHNVFIGPYAVIYGHGGVTIGENTLVSMHCRILSSNHRVPAPGIPIRSQPDVLLPTRIGRDVWLGAGVTVLGGVSIGDGCVVGAGAVVTHDLPPNTVCHGIPAHVTRMRQ